MYVLYVIEFQNRFFFNLCVDNSIPVVSLLSFRLPPFHVRFSYFFHHILYLWTWSVFYMSVQINVQVSYPFVHIYACSGPQFSEHAVPLQSFSSSGTSHWPLFHPTFVLDMNHRYLRVSFFISSFY